MKTTEPAFQQRHANYTRWVYFYFLCSVSHQTSLTLKLCQDFCFSAQVCCASEIISLKNHIYMHYMLMNNWICGCFSALSYWKYCFSVAWNDLRWAYKSNSKHYPCWLDYKLDNLSINVQERMQMFTFGKIKLLIVLGGQNKERDSTPLLHHFKHTRIQRFCSVMSVDWIE